MHVVSDAMCMLVFDSLDGGPCVIQVAIGFMLLRAELVYSLPSRYAY